MLRVILTTAAVLALCACGGPKKATFIEYKGDLPSTAPPGGPAEVWKAAAINYVDGLYINYQRGHAVRIDDLASAPLIDTMAIGHMPPIDPFCDCRAFAKTSHIVEITDLKPPLTATAHVAFTSGGATSSIYLYLVMTPLGWKVEDVATSSMRRGLLEYLRTHKKTDIELENERVAALENGEDPPNP